MNVKFGASATFCGTCSCKSLRLTAILFTIIGWIGSAPTVAAGQANPMEEIGLPHLSQQFPIPLGAVNLMNGNLHLEIPISGEFSRRGFIGPAKYALVYDSNYATGVQEFGVNYVYIYNTYLPGWRVKDIGPVEGGYVGAQDVTPDYCDSGEVTGYTYSDWLFGGADGSVNDLVGSTGVGFDTDCGDYTSYTTPDFDVYAPGGNRVYFSGGINTRVFSPNGDESGGDDSNGNETAATDTLGRWEVAESSTSSTQTLHVANTKACTSGYCATGTGGGGYGLSAYSTSDYVMMLETIAAEGFTLTEVQSLQLPDGTSFNFTYDSGGTNHFGQLTSVQLPTGATINYSYQVFVDHSSLDHCESMISSVVTPDGTWSFTPAVVSGPDIADVQMTVNKPSGDSEVVYSDDGDGLVIEGDYYSGSTLSASVTNDWAGYYGGGPELKVAETVTLPTVGGGSIHKTTQYCQEYRTENILQKFEWSFYAGAIKHDPTLTTSNTCALYSGMTPDRTTTTTYLSNSNYNTNYHNIIDRPTEVIVTDSSGSTVLHTKYHYDQSTLVTLGATGIVDHDDANFSSAFIYRGNLTQTDKYYDATHFVSQYTTYDVTGQVRSETDWTGGNATTFDYSDNFFMDAGDGVTPIPYTPPTPTNAYLHTVTLPTVGSVTLTETYGYYWGTGQQTMVSDSNRTTYNHYYDVIPHATSTSSSPDGAWQRITYPNANEVDTYVGLNSATMTTSCTSGSIGSCSHSHIVADGLGRATSQVLDSDPDGSTTIHTTYDVNGRVATISNPYRSGTALAESYTYDGLDRKLQISRTDPSTVHYYYGAAVASPGGPGGLSLQQCSVTSYGIGYPILVVDEAPTKKRRGPMALADLSK